MLLIVPAIFGQAPLAPWLPILSVRWEVLANTSHTPTKLAGHWAAAAISTPMRQKKLTATVVNAESRMGCPPLSHDLMHSVLHFAQWDTVGLAREGSQHKA